ncbi:MAG: nucleotidyltransferase domain-containing protein [Candidatus Njordarchaeia archaeon]
MLSIYKKLKELEKKKLRKFIKAVESVRDKAITLILFGSRAKETANYLSDFDVLVIGEPVFNFDFADIFFYKSDEDVKQEIDKFNSIVIDALIEGKPLIDNLGVYQTLREYALEVVKKRKLKKTEAGWVPISKKKIDNQN